MPPKTVLITGCGPHGIGAALASEFHLRGHRVIASGLSEALLKPLRDLGLVTVVMDVTSGLSIREAVSHVSKLTDGKLDILINNAGLLHIMPFTDTDPADARRVFDVNVLGNISVTHAFLPLLIASSSDGAGGDSIVANLGSINTILHPPFVSVYNAAKAAVEVLSSSLRAELAPLGVRVIILKTGCVRTDLFTNAAPLPLPADSWYSSLREFLERRELAWTPVAYMEPEVYARGVVTELLRPSVRAVVWRGAMTMGVWLLSWLPETTMVRDMEPDSAVFSTWANGLNRIGYTARRCRGSPRLNGLRRRHEDGGTGADQLEIECLNSPLPGCLGLDFMGLFTS
ncbi:short-chain dehydrogenase/reductase [Apiospora rasikravindrae]|uniref:Short-chain dehydrogenase/reductase n=1 Tax=Apiospora rasikravindrae TaxID=990691 RepID=A0ABR1SPD8_9PEZI